MWCVKIAFWTTKVSNKNWKIVGPGNFTIRCKKCPEELFFITPERQKLLTSNFDTVNKIYLVVFVKNFKVIWLLLMTSSLFSDKHPLKKITILVYFLNLNNSFDTDGITMKLYVLIIFQINLLKRFGNVTKFRVYFTDQNIKSWKNSNFERFWAIIFSQNIVIKNMFLRVDYNFLEVPWNFQVDPSCRSHANGF